jgi:hypothetical protein
VPELVSGASHEPSWLDVGRLRGDTGFTEAVDLATGLEFYLTWLEGGNER